jgi:group I intron endonuclease
MKSGIYKITNIVNGKFYIGSSKDIEWRWYCHKHYLKTNCHGNPKLQHSWNFHGEDKFQFAIIEEVEPTEKLLLEREQYYLDTWQPFQRTIGYNICPKAEGGDNITHNPNKDKFIEKMRNISTGENNPMFGEHHTEEAKKLQREKAKGRFTLKWFIERHGDIEGPVKFENRRQMLKNRKMNHCYDNGMKGTTRGPMPEEIRKRISERKKHLKTLKPELHKDIMSDQYTMKQLTEKFGVSLSTIKYEQKKLLINQKT